MWELDHKGGWTLKNQCFWTVVLEKTLKSLLDYKEIKPVHPKENQPWIFFWNDWKLQWCNWLAAALIWNDWCWSWSSNTLATWCDELTPWKSPWFWERLKAGGEGTTEDEMVGWHHWLIGHEFEQAPGDGDAQGSLECCSPWGWNVLDITERLNWLTDWGTSCMWNFSFCTGIFHLASCPQSSFTKSLFPSFFSLVVDF